MLKLDRDYCLEIRDREIDFFIDSSERQANKVRQAKVNILLTKPYPEWTDPDGIVHRLNYCFIELSFRGKVFWTGRVPEIVIVKK